MLCSRATTQGVSVTVDNRIHGMAQHQNDHMALQNYHSSPWIGQNRGEKDVKPLQRHSELMVESWRK